MWRINMKKGFMDFVATILIPDFPGETAQWYAEHYLEERGDDGSDAKHPVQSLANTLSKQVLEGKEKRVRRHRVGGVYRYFPVAASDEGHLENVVVQVSLSTQELEDIDNLVAVEKFNNRNDAIKWLVVEGIKANRGYLDKVADTRKQIEDLKRGV
jgi:Arc/MetJ-type ribon-helix-helix transcriptional regulator